jgi:hypothetical protein
LVPGEYEVASVGIAIVQPIYDGQYFPGLDGFDCDTCGGTITIDSVEADFISGTVTVTVVRITPMPPSGQLPTSTMTADFVAARDEFLNPFSPYGDCVIEYEEN